MKEIEKLQRQLEEDTAGQEKAAEDEPAVAEGDFTCTICQEDFWTFPVTTECGHTFCKPCARMLTLKSKIKPPAKRLCPSCRDPTKPLGYFCVDNEVDEKKEQAVIGVLGLAKYKDNCRTKHEEMEEEKKDKVKNPKAKHIPINMFIPADYIADPDKYFERTNTLKRPAEQEAGRPSKRARLPGVAA